MLLLAIHVGANGTGLVERCYGSVTLRTPTPEGSPRIRLSAHRYRIVTETTPSVKMEGSAELWHVLPLADGGCEGGPLIAVLTLRRVAALRATTSGQGSR